jgi:hypothetical protein
MPFLLRAKERKKKVKRHGEAAQEIMCSAASGTNAPQKTGLNAA